LETCTRYSEANSPVVARKGCSAEGAIEQRERHPGLYPTINALHAPDIDASLDEEGSRQRFWPSVQGAWRLVRRPSAVLSAGNEGTPWRLGMATRLSWVTIVFGDVRSRLDPLSGSCCPSRKPQVPAKRMAAVAINPWRLITTPID
jgi:hypothetical protein